MCANSRHECEICVGTRVKQQKAWVHIEEYCRLWTRGQFTVLYEYVPLPEKQ